MSVPPNATWVIRRSAARFISQFCHATEMQTGGSKRARAALVKTDVPGVKPALFFLHEHCSNISVDSARNRYEESEHPGHQDREMMKLHRPKMDRSQQAPGVRVHHYALGSVQYGAGGAARGRCKNHQARHPAAQDLTLNIATRDLRGAAERSPTVLSPPPAFPD